MARDTQTECFQYLWMLSEDVGQSDELLLLGKKENSVLQGRS
jgi:hypothetical protein